MLISWIILHFQRRLRFSLSCLGTVRSAARQKRCWNVPYHSSPWLLLKRRKRPHTPVSTQRDSRSHYVPHKPVVSHSLAPQVLKSLFFFWGPPIEMFSSLCLVKACFDSSGSETSWPGSSRRGSSLSLHHLSRCTKPGIIGSGSTWGRAMTVKMAALTGTSPWSCTKRACVGISYLFLCLRLFSFASVVLVSCRVASSTSMSTCGGGSGAWRSKCGRVRTK